MESPGAGADPPESKQDESMTGPQKKKVHIVDPKDDKREDKPPAAVTASEKVKRSSNLKEANVWDVIGLPPVNSVKGRIAPRAVLLHAPGGAAKRRRRISIEVHSILPAYAAYDDDSDSDEEEDGDDGKSTRSIIVDKANKLMGRNKPEKSAMMKRVDQAFVRIMKPVVKERALNVKNVAEGAGSGVKHVAKMVNVTRHLRKSSPKEGEGKEDNDDDDKSVSSSSSDDSSVGYVDGALDFDDDLGEFNDAAQWKTKYKLRLSDVKLKRRVKDTCVLNTRYGDNIDKTREIIFENEEAAIDFETKLNKQTSLSVQRDEERFRAALGNVELKDENESLELLVEIVGGVDLPILDVVSSDPYVVAKFDRKVIHKTDFLSKSLNPIWTIRTGSMFVFKVTAKDLFLSYEGLCLEVMDYDAYSGHDVMGVARVSPKFLYRATEERREFPLRPLLAKGNRSTTSGKIAVRCRRATEYDKNFLADYALYLKHKKNRDPVKLKATAKAVKHAGKGGGDFMKTAMVQLKKKEKIDGKTIIKYKVRPEPDPKRVSTTTWMTPEDIQKESMKESRVWADAGSGTLAKVYIEIISCKNLPNMDMNVGFDKNKTDSFCKIVYEDCICQTDVIDDCLSPCWMPWTNRAFILHTQHTSSPLFIGVFDYDSGLHDRLDDHDPIGRVSVNLSNLRAATVYDMHYQLWKEGKSYGDRKRHGELKIRLRMEVQDARELVFSSLQPPPTVYVNEKERKEFLCVKYTCKGPDDEKFNMNTIYAYLEELLAYYNLIVYLNEGLINVLLWRGNCKLSIPVPGSPSEVPPDDGTKKGLARILQRYTKYVSVMLPLHSATLFVAGVTVVEKPSLLPSYICASIAWLLLAVMGFRRNSPNPWDKCITFRDMMEILIVGHPLDPPPTIAENENLDEAIADRKKWEDRIKELERTTIEERKRAVRELEEEEAIGGEEDDLETKNEGMSINPLKPILYPIQQYLGTFVDCVRFTKNIIIWEECYYAFWITCASFILAVFFLFIPWNFIIIWSTRLGIWAVLGPWMKLVDIFYFSKLESKTKSELKKQEKSEMKAREKYLEKLKEEKRLKQEETTKMKAIKKYMFGKYATHVPVLKTDRYRDTPLPASTANPYVHKEYSMAQLAIEEAGSNRKRLRGQNIEGVMIPKHIDGVQKTSTGMAVSDTRKLEKGSLAASLLGGDTDLSALSKIAQIILVATVVTWAGVPMIKSIVQGTVGGIMSFF